MIKSLWEKIIKFIFGQNTQSKNEDYESNDGYVSNYENTEKINFCAIFSNKLSKYVTSQSKITIEEKNVRSKLLNSAIKKVWAKMQKIVARTFGTGGIVIIPRVSNGKIIFDLISQNRISLNKIEGEDILDATILSDIKTINQFSITKTYYRWTNYKIENNNCVITQKYTNSSGETIEKPEFWENIQDELVITNCDRVLFSMLKSPIDNRKTSDLYGVPITYGCESTISEIHECLKQIAREFNLKEAFVGADVSMFKGEGALPSNGLYRKVNSGEDEFWEVFDPAIRDSSYYNRLQELYARLEKEIGTSEGILTKPNTQNATATEIKKALYDTFVIVDNMRTNIEKTIEELMYACNVLANAYKLSPQGEYQVVYDWSYELLENSQETFNQLQSGESKGVIKKVELRQYLKPNETIEEAQKAIEEIEKSNPSTKDLLGE